jgi:hypothetical protein
MFLGLRQTMLICFLLVATSSLGGTETSTPPAPIRTMEPSTQVRVLAMLSQVVLQLEYYVKNKDLSAIHNEDVILSAAATELLGQSDNIKSTPGNDFKASLTTFCSQVSTLHLAADLNQQAKAETELGKVQEAFSKLKALFPKEVAASAKTYLETFTCPMHRDVVNEQSFARNVACRWISSRGFCLLTPISLCQGSRPCGPR